VYVVPGDEPHITLLLEEASISIAWG
jgi:hypothetical protein